MNKIWRIIRALFVALRMTVQGEALQPPEQKYPRLSQWVEAGAQLSQAAITQANTAGLTPDKRKAITLHLDMRDISMDVILGAVHHNFVDEYPLLLETRFEHTITTLYALNMNDQYRVSQLAGAPQLADYPAVVQAVEALSAHLQNIPPSNEAGSGDN